MHNLAIPSYMDWHWIWLAVAAFLAGVLNAVAGGGSFLSFPAMLGMKILPVQANATNTVALWPGQLTSIAAYRDDIQKNVRMAWPMGLAGLLGGTAGALVLLHTPQRTFHAPGAVAAAGGGADFCGERAGVAVAAAAQRLDGRPAHPPRLVPLFISTVAVCFYIGYFGAGAGFLLITMLSLFGCQDLHEINALKVVSTTLANGIAFVLFVVNGQVVWRYCLLAMVTCAIGGYSSARFAKMIPQKVLRGMVVGIGLGMAAWFFWKQ